MTIYQQVCKTCTRLRLNWYNQQTPAAEAAYRRHMGQCKRWAAEVEHRRQAVEAWQYPDDIDARLEMWAEERRETR